MNDPKKDRPAIPPAGDNVLTLKEESGLLKIAQKARVEFRMTRDGQPITDEIHQQILEDLEAYRKDNPRGNQPLAWGRLAEMIGVSASCISDIRGGKYKGNRDEVLHKIDQFLAEDRARAGRFDFRTTAKLSFTDAIFGVIRSGIRMNTMPVIVASSGVGKSQHARAFAAERSSVYLIRIDEDNCNAGGVTSLLCNAIDGLRPQINATGRKRLLAIKDWLRRHGSTVIVVDEAQKLNRSGLEMLRDIHDISDPSTRRNVPIVFFGDQDFLKLIFKGRAGGRSPLSPQCIRRMRPVLNIDTDPGCQQPGGGVYSVEDIVQIVRNNRVKLLTGRATRWLRDLANVIEYGALGNAMGVLQQCVDNLVPAGGELERLIDVADLQEALEMTFGREVAIEIDTIADGALMRKVAVA